MNTEPLSIMKEMETRVLNTLGTIIIDKQEYDQLKKLEGEVKRGVIINPEDVRISRYYSSRGSLGFHMDIIVKVLQMMLRKYPELINVDLAELTKDTGDFEGAFLPLRDNLSLKAEEPIESTIEPVENMPH